MFAFTLPLWLLRVVNNAVQALADWLLFLVNGIRALGDTVLAGVFLTAHALFPTVNWDAQRAVVEQINGFFPLSETITYALALGALWSFVLVYRLVKSWIPTVSS